MMYVVVTLLKMHVVFVKAMAHVLIALELQMVMLLKMNVARVIQMPLMIVYQIVLVFGVVV